MRLRHAPLNTLASLLLLGTLPARVLCTDILKTSGFSTCLDNSDIQVQHVDVQYDRAAQIVTFDVAGTSSKSQNVKADLTVTAYGKQVYEKAFDPCDNATRVEQLCPVPVGQFAAAGNLTIPSQYANMIPSIAFQIPDLDGMAKLVLKSADTNQDLACLVSQVNNGKSVNVPAVSYIAVGIAGAALVLSGVSAISAAASGAHGGSGSTPSFSDVIGWFQAMAMNGMISADYPPIYRNFAKNFGFSTGLVPWTAMQKSIDSFRNNTGGNLTTNSVEYLQNATLVYTNSVSSSTQTKRSIDLFFDEAMLHVRDVSTSINGSTAVGSSTNNSGGNKAMHYVHGIQAFVEQLAIPSGNTFITVLEIFAIVVAGIAVGILLVKVILETWALFASFPKGLTGFRKRYWGTMGRTIVNLILIIYGMWVLYSVYEFTHGDSWAGKVLAGVTLAVFTGILGFFTFKIWSLAKKAKKIEGDTSRLYDDKETWIKYSLFYDQYKKDLWWIFIPTIVYMFAKGFIIAAGDGHGMFQSVGQLTCEILLLGLLLWSRPYVTKAGMVIHIIISVARVLSVVCVLIFVDQLGISKETKSITGVILIAVQSSLTGLLAILIAVNAIIICVKENPHRKRRKEAEKLNRDLDTLTPLDARNSLLMDPTAYQHESQKGLLASHYTLPPYRDSSPRPDFTRRPLRESTDGLIHSAAPIGGAHGRNTSAGSFAGSPPPASRQPQLPNLGFRGAAL